MSGYKSHLQKIARTRLEDVLLDEGVLERDTIDQCVYQANSAGQLLSHVLVQNEILDEWQLAKVVAAAYSLPFIDLGDISLQTDVFQRMPLEFCYQNGILPMDEFGPTLSVAACEMPSPDCLGAMMEQTGKVPFIYVVVRRQLIENLEALAKSAGLTVPAHLQSLFGSVSAAPPPPDAPGGDLPELAASDFASDTAWETIFDLGDDAVKSEDEEEGEEGEEGAAEDGGDEAAGEDEPEKEAAGAG